MAALRDYTGVLHAHIRHRLRAGPQPSCRGTFHREYLPSVGQVLATLTAVHRKSFVTDQ